MNDLTRPSLNHRQRVRAHESGQSLVEMTLGMIVLLILLLGVMDIGRLYFTIIALQNASAEGALYASAFPNCLDEHSPAPCSETDNVEYRVENQSLLGMVDWNAAEIKVFTEDPSGPKRGKSITVEVKYNFRIFTPFITTIVGSDEIPVTVKASQLVVVEP